LKKREGKTGGGPAKKKAKTEEESPRYVENEEKASRNATVLQRPSQCLRSLWLLLQVPDVVIELSSSGHEEVESSA